MATKPKPKPKPPSRSQQRFTRQARDEAFLRFNPERSTLRGALQDAADTLEGEVSTARGTARGVQQAAREAAPVLRKTFGEGQATVSRGEQDIREATGGSPLAPAAARDAVGAQRRLAETMAGALAETTARQTEAESGASFAINQATDRYGRNVDRVQTRLGDLSQEEGRYVSGRLGELLGEQDKRQFEARENRRQRSATARENARNRKATATQNRAGRAVTKRGQTLAHQDRVAEAEARAKAAQKKAKANPTLPGGNKPRTVGERTTFRDQVSAALRVAKPRAGLYNRDELRGLLLNGQPERSVVDDKKLAALQKQNPNASITDLRRQATTKLPAVPKVPDSQLSVVLDMVYDGHISPATARKLHQAGIIVRELPYTTNREAQRPSGVKRPATAAQRAAVRRTRAKPSGAAGSAVGGALARG